MQTIGILLPRSTFYQTIGFDLYAGLQLGLKQLGREDIKIVTENIGFGADKQQVYRSAEKLLLEENASVVVAYIGHRTAELLRPLFLAANKMLIVLDAGAHLPNEWPVCSNIFYHSLHNALGSWIIAQDAAKQSQNGGLVTGYYDGGYLHTYSISKSFEQAGGTIVFNHATGYTPEDFTMTPLVNYLEHYPNSNLLSLFSGDFVQWYFRELKEKINSNTATIYMSPFGLEEMMLTDAVFPDNEIKGIVAWSKNIDNSENKLFVATMETAGKIPNLFSLLSWESSQIVIRVLDLVTEHKNKTNLIATALQDFEFNSPRGKIFFDVKTNTSIAPMYKAVVVANKNGNCELQLENESIDVQQQFEMLTQIRPNNVNSAWYNSYACV